MLAIVVVAAVPPHVQIIDQRNANLSRPSSTIRAHNPCPESYRTYARRPELRRPQPLLKQKPNPPTKSKAPPPPPKSTSKVHCDSSPSAGYRLFNCASSSFAFSAAFVF